MGKLRLFYATNRNHIGDRWSPSGYGNKFSDDGMENLRFGKVEVTADDKIINKHLKAKIKDCGEGNGIELGNYLADQAKKAVIKAYEEKLGNHIAQEAQTDVKLGSQAMFADLMTVMENCSDVLIYIHGFNVSWYSAVGSALALQLMLQRSKVADSSQDVTVVLFTWPSDGQALPWVSYKSDRTEAKGSGMAVGRAFLKARDFLANLRDRAKSGGRPLCGQDLHLLCHSMGNYLLESALERMAAFTPGNSLPRLFEHVFLCAPDVDDNALESGQGLVSVDHISRNVTIYHNKKDKAMVVSDYTKGNPERLGGNGAAHPALLHNKVHQVDCTPVVQHTDLTQHSYYLVGNVNSDIRQSIDGKNQDDSSRKRTRHATLSNVWLMKKGT